MNRAQRCVSPYCGLPRRHRDDCDQVDHFGGECRGCLPAMADHGLYLCRLCVRRLGHDALRAVWLHEAIGVALTAPGLPGEYTSGSARDPGLDLNRAMVEARSAIRITLAGLVRTIVTERGVATPWRWGLQHLPDGFYGPPRRVRRPTDTLPALARFVDHHAAWVAAHRHAGDWAGELRAIANDPRTFRLAFPATFDRLYIGQCPLPARQPDDASAAGVCGTRLYQRADELVVTCPGCGEIGPIEWWQRQIAGELAAAVDMYAAAAYLANRWGRPVGPDTIRKWGKRTAITGVALITEDDPTRTGEQRAVRDSAGRAQYPLAAVLACARRLWGPPPGEREFTVSEYGDIVITRTEPQIVVEAAPPRAVVRLDRIQASDTRDLFISGDRLYLGNDRHDQEVVYRVVGWDPEQPGLIVEREAA